MVLDCTGMPISAAAQRLEREVKEFGLPPVFPEETPEGKAAAAAAAATIEAEEKKVEEEEMAAAAKKTADRKKAKGGGKGKVASKASKQTRQWNILAEMGVPQSEIGKFQDAHYWLSYFPSIATMDLKRLGLSADFRRSFITTDINPYYDSFIRWQFNTLRRRKDKIAFGTRLSIYSPLERQTCADHDRSVGEGVQLTEYTLVKVTLCAPYPATIEKALGDKYSNRRVILPATTLRPETMYGQTNLWVSPEGEYGIYEISDEEVFVCSPKSALNMAYQNLSPVRGQVNLLGRLLGKELLGCAVNAPHAKYEKLYCLPLTTINMDQGTAIVTSVPSDSPDDYAALMNLKSKAAFREKFGIADHMVLPFEVVPIIETPGLGMTPAMDLCITDKVVSQNDSAKLTIIKDKVYKLGFATGIMRVGTHAGEKVSLAKPLIKAEMIAAGLACGYAEPDSLVMSRSGEQCVVAMSDQWYLRYGEAQWQEVVRKHVESALEVYNPQTKKDLLLAVEWLHEWACSRGFGLGTKLPWDQQYVIESLSDSTIYMAYYTIAHLLQGSSNGPVAAGPDSASFLDGSQVGLAGIAAKDLTDDVWNYIFLSKEFPDFPQSSAVRKEKLDVLRNEFEYWYPLDLRVSGKDLIGNHLTMSLYNHAAIWPDQMESKWPRSFFANGHAMIDHKKVRQGEGVS
jgi:leucyl-tRNA synthetase